MKFHVPDTVAERATLEKDSPGETSHTDQPRRWYEKPVLNPAKALMQIAQYNSRNYLGRGSRLFNLQLTTHNEGQNIAGFAVRIDKSSEIVQFARLEIRRAFVHEQFDDVSLQ